MRILWIVNTIFPEPSDFFGFKKPIFGGWMYSLAKSLSKVPGIELAIATTYEGHEFKDVNINGVIYYLLPCKNNRKYDKKLEPFWEEVNTRFKPEVVHIHGTEYVHGLACMIKLPQLKYVVSIQGLVGIIAKYFFSGLSKLEILKNITFRDIIRRDNLFQARKKFQYLGLFEKEYLKKTGHVIGRTNWDRVHVKTINENVNYHFCNESLRDSFYSSKKWNFESCVRHTIFLSQASYPIKGVHQVLKSIYTLKKKYPNIQLRIAGPNIVLKKTFLDKAKLTGYGKIISNLLKKYGLSENVIFLGMLTEDEIVAEYQKANIFICPSSVENSPNSLGEAQILGTPTISAYVGGIPDMVENKFSGLLYRFEEAEMLTDHILSIFSDKELCNHLSYNGEKVASFRHDKKRNLDQMMQIYNDILTKTFT